ncbi:MAG: class I SAM-dependent methyltransferase, partial [Bdellovibrionales bacterium]|nr:class I SAM-dependent methyltransferase [Bdellovibrionales bacterium]
MKDLITIAKICFRERIFSSKDSFIRINEPEMAMSLEEQVQGFEVASAANGPLAPVQCFASWNASKAIKHSTKILELGCGTGHVVTKMAYMNPDKKFIALDLSEGMLRQAENLSMAMGLENIEFFLGDMTDLSQFQNCGIDAVTTSLALHHLRSEEDLIKTFKSIKKLIGEEGAFSFYDLGKLKHQASIVDFISMHDNHTPVYIEDTMNSFQAGFTKKDFSKALVESGLKKRSTLKVTLVVPAFLKAHSELHPLDQIQKARFNKFL